MASRPKSASPPGRRCRPTRRRAFWPAHPTGPGGLAAGTGGRTGDGLGGGLANLVDAQATVQQSIVADNLAQGGPHGGNGFGGGFYNDATSSLTVQTSIVTGNHANASDGGEGIGGGVYNLGTLNMIATFLEHNHATTSNDDHYG